MQPDGAGPVAVPARRHRPDRAEIGPGVAARRDRFLLEAIEIRQGEREAPFPDPPLRAGEEQAEAALPHLGMHPVDRLGLVEQVERPAVGAAPLGCARQVQQRLEVPRVRLPPRFGLGLGPPGVARLPVGDERAKDARIGIGLPRARQETAAIDELGKLAGPDQVVELRLRRESNASSISSGSAGNSSAMRSRTRDAPCRGAGCRRGPWP